MTPDEVNDEFDANQLWQELQGLAVTAAEDAFEAWEDDARAEDWREVELDEFKKAEEELANWRYEQWLNRRG